MEHASEPGARASVQQPAAERILDSSPDEEFVDNRSSSIAERTMAAAIDASPRATAQRALNARVDGGGSVVAQLKRIVGLLGGPKVVQRAGEAIDDRATSWKGADAAADAKRLAVAKAEYIASGGAGGTGGKFDKSLEGNAEGNAATLARLGAQKEQVGIMNDISPEALEDYKKDPAAAAKKHVLTKAQEATAAARIAGGVGGMNNFAAHFAAADDPKKQAREAARDKISKPEDLFTPGEIEAHLGEFKDGAHAFIDVGSSDKIDGKVKDPRFKGWGIDANFVAPLPEANALNAKAHGEKGIMTLEDELGIPGRNWSKSVWNPLKRLVRWVIPKPKLSVKDAAAGGVLLGMATGKEVGADPNEWVAGGLTKGGAHEARLEAIPRADLVTLLAQGEIKQKIEQYPETPDNIQ